MNIQELVDKKSSIWDSPVPIVRTGHIIEAYLHDAVEDPSFYNELCHTLRNTSIAEEVRLYLNTPGGVIDSAFQIIDAIKASKGNVTACLSGTVASAGTVIALSCNDLEVADHTTWMSHNYSGGMSGKGHEMKARQKFVDQNLNESFRQIHSKFFTDDEIEDIIEGKDFWMGKDEVLSRWKNTKKKEPKAKVV